MCGQEPRHGPFQIWRMRRKLPRFKIIANNCALGDFFKIYKRVPKIAGGILDEFEEGS